MHITASTHIYASSNSRRSGYCVNHTWVYGAGICIWPPTSPMSGLSLILDLFLVDLDTLDTF